MYEDPHPEGTLVSISYLPAKGKEAVVVELLGYATEKSLRAMYTDRPILEWGDEFAMDGGL